MKKLFVCLACAAVTFLFTTCKQYTANIEDYLSYWAAEVSPADFSFDTPSQKSADGTVCLPSAIDVTLTVNLRNPQNFRLVMPTSVADAQKVIRFPHLDSLPVYGTDYSLQQTAVDTLILTYKKAFLKKHEWSKDNIGVEITLTSEYGRTFGKRFNVNVQANTAPSLERAEGGIGKTQVGTKWYYVLIFHAQGVDDPLPPPFEHLHKDIKQLHLTKEGAGSTVYNITGIDFTHKTFSSDSPAFLSASAVQALAAGDCEGTPPSLPTGDWLMYVKTDVEVSPHSRLATYTARLSDVAGLFSAEAVASTAVRAVAPIQIGETYPIGYHHESTENGEEATPYKVICDENGVTLQAGCSTPGATVSYSVYDITSDTVQKGEGLGASPLNGIQLPAPSEPPGTVIKYKIDLTAAAGGFNPPNQRTVYYELKRAGVTTIDAAAENLNEAWKRLKTAVSTAQAGDIIIVKGTIKATNDAGNNGVIPINRNLTIQGERSGSSITSVLDAAKGTGGKPERRIFTVAGAGTVLTLKDVALKNGKANGPGADGEFGGAILIKQGAQCTITTCELSSSEAVDCGGAIFVERGAECTITNSKIDGNKAIGMGGGVYIQEPYGSTPAGKCVISGGSFTNNEAKGAGGGAIYTAGTLELSNCAIGDASVGNKASGANGKGGAISINGGTANLINCTVTDCQADSGGGIYNKGTLTVSGGSFTNNKATGTYGNGGAIYSRGSLTVKDGCTIGGSNATDGNTANSLGGGIFELAEGDGEKGVSITGTTISNNTAQTGGGGIALLSSHGGFITAVLDTVTVKNNVLTSTSSSAGAGIYFGGGYNNNATLTIRGGSITGNRADYGNGGGIYIGTNSTGYVYGTLTLKDGVRISGNTAETGGGIAVRSATLMIESGCTIGGSTTADGNTAKNGGGIALDQGGTLMLSGEIKGNIAQEYGGGVYLYGGGVFTMTGGTITGNSAANHGGAVFVGGTFNWQGGSITGNSGPDILYKEGTGTINNTSGNTAS